MLWSRARSCLGEGFEGGLAEVAEEERVDLLQDFRAYFQDLALVLDRNQGAAGAEREVTVQQRGVLRLLADGRSTREIAAQLGLSEKTVKGYNQEIFRRLYVNNRVAAAMRASRAGWL